MKPVRVHPLVLGVVTIFMALLIYKNISCSKYFEDPVVKSTKMDTAATTSSISSKVDANIPSVPLEKFVAKNYAPSNILADKSACKVKELWGREHHGGWYVCKDTLIKADKATTSSEDRSCLVYSYGLGMNTVFIFVKFSISKLIMLL